MNNYRIFNPIFDEDMIDKLDVELGNLIALFSPIDHLFPKFQSCPTSFTEMLSIEPMKLLLLNCK